MNPEIEDFGPSDKIVVTNEFVPNPIMGIKKSFIWWCCGKRMERLKVVRRFGTCKKCSRSRKTATYTYVGCVCCGRVEETTYFWY